MSVKTTSDIKCEEALDHVNMAYKLLIEAMDPDTHGHDDYNKEYVYKIDKAIDRLRKIKRDLS